jgi:predicted DNA-binding transcriptional regulator YafY
MSDMNRTERLFALMDALRRHRRPVTAASLADELAVSLRTIYRDVQVLIGLGAPIDGEAGLLGIRWVARQSDTALTQAAMNALAKIAAASPKDMRDAMANTGLWVATIATTGTVADIKLVREAIRRERKLRIAYVAETGAATERAIWPIAMAYYERRQTVAAWCELRGAFRHFRTDRITALTATEQRYPRRRVELVEDWRRETNFSE